MGSTGTGWFSWKVRPSALQRGPGTRTALFLWKAPRAQLRPRYTERGPSHKKAPAPDSVRDVLFVVTERLERGALRVQNHVAGARCGAEPRRLDAPKTSTAPITRSWSGQAST